MITAVDSNVLFDILIPSPLFGPVSKRFLENQYGKGSLIISEIVYAELSSLFQGRTLLDEILREMNIRLVSSPAEVLYSVGQIWKHYRKKRGPKTRILADFFIGAHAAHEADCLLTRDRGFYRDYFQGLKIVEPSL
ncbi:MAG: PIN domain-containing protein [Deltaproteobacteria bacterium]|nr:PIN domain-containing protein [Deltaproteobacteria bacterium]